VTSSRVLLALVTTFSFALDGCIPTQRTSPDDVVGAGGLKPVQEDKDAGLVAMAPGFNLKEFVVITVERFEVDSSQIEDEGDRVFAREMATFYQSELVRRLRESNLFQRVGSIGESEMPAAAGPTLQLRGVITRLGRGSRAGRFWAGAIGGAGRTRAQAEMHFVDARSGGVVLVTADRRLGASGGVFGSSDEHYLRESFGDMSQDLVRFLERLARGESPQN